MIAYENVRHITGRFGSADRMALGVVIGIKWEIGPHSIGTARKKGGCHQVTVKKKRLKAVE